MSQLVHSGSFEYLYYGSTTIINIFILPAQDRLPESDDFIHQILMYKDGPRAGN